MFKEIFSNSFTPVSWDCPLSEGNLYWFCPLGHDFGVHNSEYGGFHYAEVTTYSNYREWFGTMASYLHCGVFRNRRSQLSELPLYTCTGPVEEICDWRGKRKWHTKCTTKMYILNLFIVLTSYLTALHIHKVCSFIHLCVQITPLTLWLVTSQTNKHLLDFCRMTDCLQWIP